MPVLVILGRAKYWVTIVCLMLICYPLEQTELQDKESEKYDSAIKQSMKSVPLAFSFIIIFGGEHRIILTFNVGSYFTVHVLQC